MLNQLFRLMSVCTFAASAAIYAQTPTPLEDAVYGKPYNITLHFQVSGVSPFTYSIVSGSGALPSCLRLSPDGILSGVPAAACRGTYAFQVVATDNVGGQSMQKYVLHVTDGKTAVTQASVQNVQMTPVQPTPAPQSDGANLSTPAAPDAAKPKEKAPTATTTQQVGRSTVTANTSNPSGSIPTPPPPPNPPIPNTTDTASCANTADGSQPTPVLNVVDVDTTTASKSGVAGDVINGKVNVQKGVAGTVQICLVASASTGTPSYTPIGSPINVTDGSFSLSLVDSSSKASLLPAPITAGQQIVAQWSSTSPGKPIAYSQASAAVVAGDCSGDPKDQQIPQPTIINASGVVTLDPGNSVAVEGTVPQTSGQATTGQVRTCIDGLQLGTPVTVAQFSSQGVTVPKLAAGSVVVAQVISSTKAYGPFSSEVAVGTCTSTGSGDITLRPKITTVPGPGDTVIKGNVPIVAGKSMPASVRVCLVDTSIASKDTNDREVTLGDVGPNGDFTAVLPYESKYGSKYIVQPYISNAVGTPRTYGLPSDVSSASGLRFSNFFGSFIGGIEESGYSSDGINTNAFLSAFMRANYLNLSKDGQMALAGWGRIRLLSAPQQSAPNIVATIADPTGQISETSLSSVGAVIDYVVGGELRIRQGDTPSSTSRFSLIADFGETTPLNTASPTVFNAPQVNTNECMNLIAQNNGVLVSGAGLSTPACLENPVSKTAYSYVGYTQQKRTGFLFKYGGGVRFTRITLPKQQGGSIAPYMLDFTLGQDETITNGKLWGPVFRLDGQIPFPIPGASSYVYIFGSSSVKLRKSQDVPTITLGIPQGGIPALPDPTVVVLSTQQPDRDFYRIGVGLNLTALISSWTKTNSNAPASTATATGNSTK